MEHHFKKITIEQIMKIRLPNFCLDWKNRKEKREIVLEN